MIACTSVQSPPLCSKACKVAVLRPQWTLNSSKVAKQCEHIE